MMDSGRRGYGGGQYVPHCLWVTPNGGDIRTLPPEDRHTVNSDQNHHISVSGGGSAPWGAGVPVVVGTGETETGGDTGSGKGNGNGRDGGGGGQGRAGRLSQRGIL